MLPLRTLPVKIKYFCDECKTVREFELSGLATNGYFYRCLTCGKLKIIKDEELIFILGLQNYI